MHQATACRPSVPARRRTRLLACSQGAGAPAAEPVLRRFGVSHVLMFRKPFYKPAFLAPRFVSEGLVVYEVLPPIAPRPLRRLDLARNGYRAEVEVGEAQPLELPIAYNPHWRALVDGQPRAVERSEVGLLRVPVARGASTIELRFRRTPAENAMCMLSLLSWAAALALLWRGARPAAR